MFSKLTRTPFYFLLLYLSAGVLTIRHFGVPTDDFTQYVIGQQNYHVLIGEEKLENIDAGIKYYGPVFETFCYTIDSMFYGEPEPIQKWGMRHCLVFLLFTLALLYLWKLAKLIFNKISVAWILMLLAAVYPRLFADAHYNSKDTVFLSLTVIGLCHLCKGIKHKQTFSFLFAGIVLGMATTLRLAGFFIVPAFFISHIFSYGNYNKIKLWIAQPIFFVVFFLLSYYVFFPALWKDPLHEFGLLVKHITHFPWPHNTLVAGQWVGTDSMPWWYFPVWFFITVPVLYHLIFLVSCVILVLNFKLYAANAVLRTIVLFAVFTVFYVIIMRPNLYDGWRQLQFIFIPFVLIMGIAVSRFMASSVRPKAILPTVLVLYQAAVCVWLHPYQYVYFNEAFRAFGKPNSYDQDYWALSTGKCMQWIKKHSKKDEIKIYSFGKETIWLNTFLFPKDTMSTLIPVKTAEQADYEIEAIRNSKPYQQQRNVVYSICPLKDTIARVIQLKPEN